jgi:hypothetical protein
MPYSLVKVGTGYKVKSILTGKLHSKKALPKHKAKAQLRALFAAMAGKEKL